MTSPFKKMAARPLGTPDPEGLFSELKDRDPKIRGLLSHQADVLREYKQRFENSKDVAAQLPTGSGKTLVGLLIAEWRRRTKRERALYLCPTRQLANQVGEKAHEYGLQVDVFIGSKRQYDPQALAAYNGAKRIAVTNYSSLFNVAPGLKDPKFIVLDDAHVAENYVARHWSCEVQAKRDAGIYKGLLETFEKDLPPSFVDRIEGVGGKGLAGFELIPSSALLPRVKQVREVIDAGITQETPLDLRFGWQVVAPRLEACQMYVSQQGILLRPVIPPSLTHDDFAGANQRFYMSATIGSEGDLERMVGVPTINRIPTPAKVDRRSSGRRLFLFPDISATPEAAANWAFDEAAKRQRVLVVCRDSEQLDAATTELEKRNISVLLGTDVEESLDSFVQEDDIALVVASRFDGIDLPDDDCRFELLLGKPDALNLQERFFLTRLGMKDLLRERVNKRFTQAVGRCTRSELDFAVVVPLGRDLIDFCSRPENLGAMDSDLAAEIEFGTAQSQGSSLADLSAMVTAFLDDKGERQGIDAAVGSLRDEVKRDRTPANPAPYGKLASNEVDYTYKLWGGDAKAAADAARAIVDQATFDNSTLYRAWWAYLTGSAYVHLWMQTKDKDHLLLADRFFRVAKGAGPLASWYARLPHLSGHAAPSNASDLAVSRQVERVQTILARLGMRGQKFEDFLADTKKRLENREASPYEVGLRQLGELIGLESDRPDSSGAPDGWWRVDEGGLILFEAKTEEDPSHGVSKGTCTEALGHYDWAKANLEADKEKSAVIVVTPRTKLHEVAVPHAGNLWHQTPAEILEVFSRVVSTLRDLRANVADIESEEARVKIREAILSSKLDGITVTTMLRSRPLSKLQVVS